MTIDRIRGRATNQSAPVERMWDRIILEYRLLQITMTHLEDPQEWKVNMLKIVNHIGATRESQEKHLKFPIDVDPRGPYKHYLVVRVDTGADVNCMNEKTFKKLFPKVKLCMSP